MTRSTNICMTWKVWYKSVLLWNWKSFLFLVFLDRWVWFCVNGHHWTIFRRQGPGGPPNLQEWRVWKQPNNVDWWRWLYQKLLSRSCSSIKELNYLFKEPMLKSGWDLPVLCSWLTICLRVSQLKTVIFLTLTGSSCQLSTQMGTSTHGRSTETGEKQGKKRVSLHFCENVI